MDKTKILVFVKDMPIKTEPFMMLGEVIEEVKSIRYLGVKYSVGLNFFQPIKKQVSKAKVRIGFL